MARVQKSSLQPSVWHNKFTFSLDQLGVGFERELRWALKNAFKFCLSTISFYFKLFIIVLSKVPLASINHNTSQGILENEKFAICTVSNKVLS